MADVLLYKETILPRSETFILAQMQSLRRVSARLIGLEPVPESLISPSASLLLSRRSGTMASLRAKIYRHTGFAPVFHTKARRENASLLHAHFASGGISAIPLARSLKVPLLVTLHGSDITVPWTTAAAMAMLGRTARLFLCVSQFIRDRALAAGLPPEKLRVHYIGIDLTKFQPPSESADLSGILFVGRLVEKKGCAYLLRAMQIVQRRYPDAMLTIIGDGPLRSELEALASALQIRCAFLGQQPSSVVREYLLRTRIFCAPSVTAADGDSEGLPTVLAEAHGMGIPAVSTQHAGIPEIVLDGRTGFLVEERDHEALSSAITSLLGNSSMWRQFSAAAQEHVAASFDMQKQSAELEMIYQDLISEQTAQGR